jgi:hypothetical protein
LLTVRYCAAAGRRRSAGRHGHAVLFGSSPVYGGETIGSEFLVFNTIMHLDSLDAGRTLDIK